MELTKISSSSSSYLTILNYNRSAALTRKHTTIRCRKQGLSVMFIIVSKFNDKQVNPRRSANYHPSIWDHKLIESFTTPYSVSPTYYITLLFPIYLDIYALISYLYYMNIWLCCSMSSMALDLRG